MAKSKFLKYDKIMLSKQKSTEPIKGIHWQITDTCNYQCEYCIDRQYNKSFRNGFSNQKTIHKVLDTIFKLPGRWQIKFGNNESTLHPGFLDICEAISSSRHTMCLATNFSSSREELKKIIDTCGEKLDFVTASLHLGQTDVEAFIEKSIWFNSMKHSDTQFAVTNVMTKENFDKLKQLRSTLEKQGIQLRFQIFKYKDRYVTYSRDIEEYIIDKLMINQELLRSKSFFGKECYTGNLYFVIDLHGDAYRCYGMMKDGYLGNIVKGTFKRYSEPTPCLALKCNSELAVDRNLVLFNERRNIVRIIKCLAKSKELDKKFLKRAIKRFLVSNQVKK